MYSADQLKEVAQRYFIDHQTQEQISKAMFCSRSTISRMIHKSMELGIVKIQLVESIERVGFLEEMFKEKFGIREVRICRTTNKDNKTILNLLASRTLDDCLHDGITIGISRGRTMRNMVDTYKGSSYKDTSIVQIFGIANNENENYEGPKIVDILSEKMRGKGYYLFTPHYIENDIVRAEFKKMPTTVQSLSKTEECEYIFSGINGGGSEVRQNIWTKFMKEIKKENPDTELVGTLLGYAIDINGNIIESDMYPKLIGRSLHFFLEHSKVVVVATGEEKAKVILGALRGKLMDTLIIDEKTAYLVYTLAGLV
jgi:dihydroxyacetone kinase